MLKKGAKVVAKESVREFWRRHTVVLTLDKFGVPRPIQDAIPWIRRIRAEIDEEIEQEAAQAEALQEQVATPLGSSAGLVAHEGVDLLYQQYRCWCGDPLSCNFPYQTIQEDPKAATCKECGFPAVLLEKREIRGRRGRYRIEGFLGRRGMGRLYRGIEVSDHQPVVIKEYLLPTPFFNAAEVKQRKQGFERLAGVNAADGRVQDFRLRQPWEAIADVHEERCYLLTKGNLDTCPTLSTYLLTHGAMTHEQVRHVLNQVLQTLEFLHGQKFRLPSGQMQVGLAHGNISLDSLLIVAESQTFFIHLCDLSLWERLFDPKATDDLPNISRAQAQDLINLGYVAFYLLLGRTVEPVTGIPFDPQKEQHWPLVDPALKAFILRLLALDVPFPSAEEARQALLRLPPEQLSSVVRSVEPEEVERVKVSRTPFLIFGAITLLALGILAWWLLPKPQASESAENDRLPCCFKEVPAVPPGDFIYTTEKDGTWDYIHKQFKGNLNQPLETKLKERQPKLALKYATEASTEEAIAKVQSEAVNFAIANLLTDFPSDLQAKPIGYDGIVVFVAFSYSHRDKSLPKALNGQITVEQLRQLYTGKIQNWRQLGGPDLAVKLYIPTEKDAVRIFEQRVLKDKDAIASFRSLQPQETSSTSFSSRSSLPEIQPLPTNPKMLQQVIQDFEDQGVGGIGFGSLSKVFGQCAAYPLAIAEKGQTPVQVLVQDNGNPIDPNTDLCNNKGSYHPKIEVFQSGSYLLGYPVAVVYPRDNSRSPAGAKFADMLRTREGQKILSQAGLVPLQRF
jgi:ABC-type phosphate transport system substrate-binding protein